jgi:hypothetical protein
LLLLFPFIASYDHHGNNTTTYGNATWKVDSRKEAADLFIMNHTAKGDITVTQDIEIYNSDDRSKFTKEINENFVEICRNLDFFAE